MVCLESTEVQEGEEGRSLLVQGNKTPSSTLSLTASAAVSRGSFCQLMAGFERRSLYRHALRTFSRLAPPARANLLRVVRPELRLAVVGQDWDAAQASGESKRSQTNRPELT